MLVRTLAALLMGLATLWNPASAQDQVELTDGTKLEGRVIYEDDEELVLLYSATKERTVPAAKVKTVRSLTRSLHEALDHWDRLEQGDVAGLWQLTTFCRDRGLKGETQIFAWMVLIADPEHAQAHELLGHQKKGGTWQAQDGKAWLSLERLYKKRQDFQDAWEFPTLHYRLKSNLPFESAVAIAIDLERFYRFFYSLFGKELKLREVAEPMHAAVYADAKSYPEPTDNTTGYFSTTLNTLFVLADRGLEPQVIYHAATQQLLYTTSEREPKARGKIPAWVSQGLAMYLTSSVDGMGGHATFDPGKAAPNWFAEHSRAKKPFDLSRMFSFLDEDFATGSNTALKYAQSYSLVHYCLHGDGGKLRPGFMDYLRRVYRGDASSTAFQEALGVREQDMEKAWHAYARSLSGG